LAICVADHPEGGQTSQCKRVYATFALWMMFLLGKHAMFGHAPPMYLRWTTATCFPSPAKSPRSDGRARATPENHEIKFFWLRLLTRLGG